eukprot:360295-Chlamydomonas_euryale.AAC.3
MWIPHHCGRLHSKTNGLLHRAHQPVRPPRKPAVFAAGFAERVSSGRGGAAASAIGARAAVPFERSTQPDWLCETSEARLLTH